MPTISVTTRHWKNVNIQDFVMILNLNWKMQTLKMVSWILVSIYLNLLSVTSCSAKNSNYNLNPPGSMTMFVMQGKPPVNLSENVMTMEVHRQKYGNQRDIVKNMIK